MLDPKGSSQGTILRVTPPRSKNPVLFVSHQDLNEAFLIQSEEDYLAVVQDTYESQGFEAIRKAYPVRIVGRTFYRLDTHSRRRRNRTYQAAVVIILGKGTADRKLLAFGAAGMSGAEIEKVLGTLETLEFRE